MANVAAIVANKGYFYTPHIIREIGDSAYLPAQFTERHYCTVDSQYFGVVQDGMQMAVDHGTAFASRIPGIVMCGKTGTAQNPHGKDHSVFIAFAPRDTPRIAIAVVVENAGYGASWAAPIASLIVEKYLRGKDFKTERKWMEDRMLKADFINHPLPDDDDKKNTGQAET